MNVIIGGLETPVYDELVSWCFKPSQPQCIISGLRETFIQRYIVERTHTAEKDQKNRVRKRSVIGRNYGKVHFFSHHFQMLIMPLKKCPKDPDLLSTVTKPATKLSQSWIALCVSVSFAIR